MSEQSSNDEQEGKVPLEMKDLKKLYACVKCRLIKSEGSFKTDGCENCGDMPQYVKHFEGMIFIMKPEASWVAKWNKLTTIAPGCYCVRIAGETPQSEGDDEEEDDE